MNGGQGIHTGGIACLLALQLIVTPLPAAQQQGIKIVILEGEAAIHNIRQRTARELVVRVEDEAGKPVEGASVNIISPSSGASVTFADRAEATATTDPQGRAVIRGVRPNHTPGKVELRINVSHAGQTARATVTQFNMVVENPAPKKSGHGKMIAILAVVGAGAAGGILAGTRGGSSTATAPTTPVAVPPIGIIPGTGTVGAPR
jgi:hypothetical protein